MAQLLIYRASAGSGKTHMLVTRYIQWALRYPDAFKHILAVTFTNRATQEMKQRILACFYSLSMGQETALQKTLCQAGWSLSQLQLRSKAILSRMVYHYGDFSVTTIDSFFHKIIQSFTKSLGLPHHFAIEMDELLALKESIEELLTLDDPLLQKWIADFALTKLLAGQTWHVKSNIQELGKALFNESFKLHEKALLTAFQEKERWSHLVLVIQESVRSFEAKMQKIGQNALTILKQAKLSPSDFTYGTKGVIGYFFKLANKKDYKPTKRAIIGRDNLKSWYAKQKTSRTADIARVVERLLHPLLVEAIDGYEQEGLAYRTAIVNGRFSYAFGMVGALLIGLERYRLKNNVLFMSDIATLLYQAIQGSDIPLLYEKIGYQFHHFLIDEFQDLSLFQWMNIKPLLRNSLAQGYSSLLVGDVKQAIYRWRGSNWKLLNHEVEATFKESRLHHLTTNQRSQEAIVLFNNHLFKTAANHLVDYLEKRSTDQPIDPLVHEWAQMRRAYIDVVQQTNGQKGGYVALWFFRSDQTDTAGQPIVWQIHAQKAFITLLEQLQKEGIPAKDIVVLIRNNSEANLITSLFTTNATPSSYQVQSDHAHTLWSHIAIKVLIHTLYYLHDEDDLINKIAWVEVYSHCIDNHAAIGHHDRFYQAVAWSNHLEKLFPASFWLQKDFLKNVSVYTCVQLLITCLFKNLDQFSDLFSLFQSIVLHFCLTESTSIEAFLAWWEKRGRSIKLPVSHDDDTIKVMTIHQSKGLAFKIVIMPFCSWRLDHPSRNGPILWSVNHQKNSDFPIWPISYGADLKETNYAKDYCLEQMQIHLDNLNLLYVAFTRAESQLYVMAPLPEKMDGMVTIADLIYQSLITDKIDQLFGYAGSVAVKMEDSDVGTNLFFG
ncbi:MULTISPECIES: exodeoxyribonuclease V subunit beta [unclassified Candidatus Cardinium]|uniref:UvrD-helicase domain-containing protein n=1 Tax=unclassified Candidatus Cardinium TaxID=2641185 RepID=UPI001FB21380|nr:MULTISPECIES: UvrD-helicase domain-containing protein [unclassified Candidatus Cardinium]